MNRLVRVRPVRKRNRTATAGLLVILLCILLTGLVTSRNSANGSLPRHQEKTSHVHYPLTGAIDGSLDPRLIPDAKAYSLLFRFLGKAHTDAEIEVNRSLIRKMGLTDRDADGVLAASAEFNRMVGELDREALEIKPGKSDRPQSLNALTLTELSRLDQEKSDMVTNVVASLPGTLSQSGLDHLRSYMGSQFKRNIKSVPAR